LFEKGGLGFMEKKPQEKDKPDGIDICVNRRRFLAGVGATIGAAAIAGPAGDAFAEKEFEGWPDRFGCLTDLTLCVGCRSCESACNRVNNLPPPEVSFEDGSVFKENRRPDAKAFTVVNRYPDPKNPGKYIYRKVQCNHCNEPACFSACPVHAYTKTKEGAVTYDESKCFGCRYCMTACPFNIPAYSYDSAFSPRIQKCVLCYDRIKAGGIPACVEACPSGALIFGKRTEILDIARSRIKKNPDKYVDYIYGEREAGGTSWLYISGVPFEQVGFSMDVPKKPPVEYARGFLSAVPMVLTIWPALFSFCYYATRNRDAESGKKEE
jgi:Fe-S-cluster-containing dehydrogenase component